MYNWCDDWLVVSPPLKNMKVSWDYEIPKIWKNEKCSKASTSDGVSKNGVLGMTEMKYMVF